MCPLQLWRPTGATWLPGRLEFTHAAWLAASRGAHGHLRRPHARLLKLLQHSPRELGPGLFGDVLLQDPPQEVAAAANRQSNREREPTTENSLASNMSFLEADAVTDFHGLDVADWRHGSYSCLLEKLLIRQAAICIVGTPCPIAWAKDDRPEGQRVAERRPERTSPTLRGCDGTSARLPEKKKLSLRPECERQTWQSIEREALKELEAAKTNRRLKGGGAATHESRRQILALTGQPAGNLSFGKAG
jgi:hypothetical protein